MSTEPMPTLFYTLPAGDLEEGMSTADGQDILAVDTLEPDGYVFATVYTPRSDDPDLDAANRADTDTRCYLPGSRVQLGVFDDTAVDGSDYPNATPL